MTQNLNQQKPTPEKGDLVYSPQPILAAQVYASEATALVPGQFVKLYASSTLDNIVVTAAANTDQVFGFVAFDIRKASFAANKWLGLWRQGSIVWAEAGEAINPGDRLMLYVSGATVQVKKVTHSKMCIAMAVTGQATTGELVQVQIIAPEAAGIHEGVSGYSGEPQ